jgi:DnaJ-domain-containing protein 1
VSEERPTADHYERLGVAPSSSTDEVRTAYRSLARRLHPDRLGAASPAERTLAERRMREINESWRVLQDPASRRRYDESRMERRRHTTARPVHPVLVDEDDGDLVEVMPPMTALKAGLMRHLPWVVLLVVLGGIFVFSAYATADRSSPPKTASTCLDVSAGTSTTMVPCAGPHDLQIIDRAANPADCPAGSEGRRLQGESIFDR